MGRLSTVALGALACASTAMAHGHLSGIVIDGVYYRGYQSDSDPYDATPPLVIGWTTDDKDNGFVQPVAFNTSDIICHRSATPAPGHAVAKPGSTLAFIWNTWPDSHVGPVYDYLANCNGPCETVDKTKLSFFKIDGPAYISGADPGYWAPNVMIKNNLTWLAQLPKDLAPGNYVLRHEIIALHAAQSLNGAQAYPQCINLQVTGSGTNSYAGKGTLGTALYKENDPGIVYNIYQSPLPSYTNPGPPVQSGLPISISQTGPMKITSTGTASTTYGQNTGGGGGNVTPTTPPASTSAPATSQPAQTTLKTTTKTTTTQAPPATTTAAGGTAALYGQCGGNGWTGPTACPAGSTCKVLNPYYSQCQT